MSRIIYLDNAATSYPKPEICLNEINKLLPNLIGGSAGVDLPLGGQSLCPVESRCQ